MNRSLATSPGQQRRARNAPTIDWSLSDLLASMPQFTEKDIEDFERAYRGGAEETEDLKKLYAEHKGSMRMRARSCTPLTPPPPLPPPAETSHGCRSLFQYQMCSREDDAYRFMQILSQAVKAGMHPPPVALLKRLRAICLPQGSCRNIRFTKSGPGLLRRKDLLPI